MAETDNMRIAQATNSRLVGVVGEYSWLSTAKPRYRGPWQIQIEVQIPHPQFVSEIW